MLCQRCREILMKLFLGLSRIYRDCRQIQLKILEIQMTSSPARLRHDQPVKLHGFVIPSNDGNPHENISAKKGSAQEGKN